MRTQRRTERRRPCRPTGLRRREYIAGQGHLAGTPVRIAHRGASPPLVLQIEFELDAAQPALARGGGTK